MFYLKHKYTEHKLKTWLKFVTSPGLHNRLISRDLTVRKYGTSTLPPCKQCLDVVHVMVARSVVERQSLTGEFSLACSTSWWVTIYMCRHKPSALGQLKANSAFHHHGSIMSSKLQSDGCYYYSQWGRRLVNAYEVNEGMVCLQRKNCVIHTWALHRGDSFSQWGASCMVTTLYFMTYRLPIYFTIVSRVSWLARWQRVS